MTKTHIIGDSHCLTFQGAKNVDTHWMGAATAFNLWKKNEHIQGILKNIPKEEEVWFCFGEIDMRIHIYKAFKETGIQPTAFFTDITWFNYVRYISTLKYKNNVSIMAVPPQGYQDNYFGYEHYADRWLRNQFTVGSYITLHGYCCDYAIPHIDIWWDKWEELCEEYSGEDLMMWPEEFFQEDKCHVKKEIAIEYLEAYLAKRD